MAHRPSSSVALKEKHERRVPNGRRPTGAPGGSTEREKRTRGRAAKIHRSDIVREAAHLFRERGFAGTSVDDIGAALKVSGPALYHHFENKAALLLAVAREEAQNAKAACEQAIADSATPKQAVENVVRSLVSIALEDRSLVSAWARGESNLPPAALRSVRKLRAELAGMVLTRYQSVRPDLNSADLQVTWAVLQGMLESVSLLDQKTDSKAARDRMIRMTLAALFHA